ncbi:unnamed protein product [Phaeothamnion confervicola]
MLTGVALTIAAFTFLNDDLNKTSDQVEQISLSLRAANGLVNEAVDAATFAGTSFSSFVSNVTTCAELPEFTVAGFNTSTLSVVATTRVDKMLASLRAELDGIAAPVYATIDDAASFSHRVSVQIDDTKDPRQIFFSVVLGVNLLVCVIYVGLGWVTFFASNERVCLPGCSKWVGCTAFPVVLLLIFSGWLVCGGAVALGIFTGDFCADPDANTLVLADNNTLVQYYTTCQGENEYKDKVLLAQAAFLRAAEAVAPALQEVVRLKNSDAGRTGAAGLCVRDLVTLGDAVSLTLWTAWTIIVRLELLISCRYINSLYAGIVYGTLCDDLTKSTVYMMIGSSLLAAALMVTMILWRIMMEQKSNVVKALQESRSLAGSVMSQGYPPSHDGGGGGSGSGSRGFSSGFGGDAAAAAGGSGSRSRGVGGSGDSGGGNSGHGAIPTAYPVYADDANGLSPHKAGLSRRQE